jgi:hypothetical protein
MPKQQQKTGLKKPTAHIADKNKTIEILKVLHK